MYSIRIFTRGYNAWLSSKLVFASRKSSADGTMYDVLSDSSQISRAFPLTVFTHNGPHVLSALDCGWPFTSLPVQTALLNKIFETFMLVSMRRDLLFVPIQDSGKDSTNTQNPQILLERPAGINLSSLLPTMGQLLYRKQYITKDYRQIFFAASPV